MTDTVRQPPAQVRFIQVHAGQLRQFRRDNPDARITSWPNSASGTQLYGFYVPVQENNDV